MVDAETEGAPAPAVTGKEAGTAFGKYTLLCKLATGGMGEIYVARQTGAGGFEKLVVIKRLLPHLAEDGHFIAMLLDEARIAARLSHANVCQVYDLGEAEGHYYIAMEHLEGVPASLILRQARSSGQRLEIGLAAALLCQTAQGLDHAHDLRDANGNLVGLVHRDVSPSNIFVTAAGNAKILDFGVAKSQDALAQTRTGALKGKYAYMSPEQVLGNPVDRRADVFSLGVVMFELFTAQRLFWRDSEYKMFQAIVEEKIPSLLDVRPGLPPAVAQVADRALSRDPARRFPTAREMGEALEDAVASSGGLWKSKHIADYVAARFGEAIAEKRREVQRGIVKANRVLRARPKLSDPEITIEGASSTESHPVVGASSRAASEVSESATPSRLSEGTQPSSVSQVVVGPSRTRSIVGAVLLAGVLGGGGAIAYQRLAGQEPVAAPPVVVLGGEVVTDDGRVARAKSHSAGTAAADDDGSAAKAAAATDGDEVASGDADAGAEAADADPAGDAKRDPTKGAKSGTSADKPAAKDPYRAALSRHQGAIRRCFNENATSVEGTPEVSLALVLEGSGKVARAGLVPSALENTALGSCILGVARGVDFEPADGPVEITIPLKVRRR